MSSELDILRRRISELEAALNAIRTNQIAMSAEKYTATEESEGRQLSDRDRRNPGVGANEITARAGLDHGRLFRLITNSTEDVIWVNTSELDKVLYVSPAYETLWERSLRELYESPRAFLAALHPEDLAAYLNTIDEKHARRRSYQHDYRIVRRNGEIRWIRERGYPAAESASETPLMVRACTDITEQKQTEEALRGSEARLRTLIDTIPDLVWLKDSEGVYLACNPAFERFFGARENEILGKTDYDFVDTDLADSFRANDRMAIDADKPLRNEEWISLAVNGRRILLDTTKTRISLNGDKHLGVLGIGHDITELRQAREKLAENEAYTRRALQATDTGAWNYEVDSRTVHWSANMEKLCGMQPDTFDGSLECVQAVIHPDDLEAWKESMRACIENGIPQELELRVVHSDGSIHWLRVLGDVEWDGDGRVAHLSGLVRDITEQKRVSDALNTRERTLASIFRAAPIGIGLAAGRVFREVNDTFCAMTGYSREDLVGQSSRILYSDQAEFDRVGRVVAKEIDLIGYGSTETQIRRKDGRPADVLFSGARLDMNDQAAGLVFTALNITQRKQSEKALQNSEKRFRALFEQAGGYFMILDPNTADGIPIIIDANAAACATHGYTREEFIGRPVDDIDDADGKRLVKARTAEIMAGQPFYVENTHVRKDGSTFAVAVNAQRIDIEESPPLIFTMEYDITERRRVEEELRYRDFLLAEVGRIAHVGGWEFDPVTGAGTWTEEVARIHGLDPTEKTDLRKGLGFFLGEHREKIEEAIQKAVDLGTPYDLELEILAADGRRKWVRTIGSPVIDQGRVVKVRGSLQDVTERKLAEIAQIKLMRAFFTLSAGNEALVRSTTEKEIRDRVCQVIVEQGAYRMACVGYIEDSPKQVLRLMASAGAKLDDGAEIVVPLEGRDANSSGLMPRAVFSGQPQVSDRLDDSTCLTKQLSVSDRNEIRAGAAFPLRLIDNRVFGILGIFSTEKGIFDEAQMNVLNELAEDLGYGIRVQRAAVSHAKAEHRLHRSMEQTIQAIAATVEQRDPYTAGHQQRVATFAVAIAHELGLDEQQIRGLRLGAIIHDLGKIHIPAEILTRPGKLTTHEFGMIKAHPEIGFEIVKDIDFQWPVADMILQHHERLNGSGYPQGLTDGQIILEARILAVADVVEAISTHRPYRAALGLGVAMEEIMKGRGSIYDTEVVDAALKLLQVKGFSFGTT
ncbi:MAG: PAS domain S-box protein [Candidatus Competibacteraceae bacterium]|nr:MAG: PAS domain S-box protein [Candidatus Competibacteraceae bacterium]